MRACSSVVIAAVLVPVLCVPACSSSVPGETGRSSRATPSTTRGVAPPADERSAPDSTEVVGSRQDQKMLLATRLWFELGSAEFYDHNYAQAAKWFDTAVARGSGAYIMIARHHAAWAHVRIRSFRAADRHLKVLLSHCRERADIALCQQAVPEWTALLELVASRSSVEDYCCSARASCQRPVGTPTPCPSQCAKTVSCVAHSLSPDLLSCGAGENTWICEQPRSQVVIVLSGFERKKRSVDELLVDPEQRQVVDRYYAALAEYRRAMTAHAKGPAADKDRLWRAVEEAHTQGWKTGRAVLSALSPPKNAGQALLVFDLLLASPDLEQLRGEEQDEHALDAARVGARVSKDRQDKALFHYLAATILRTQDQSGDAKAALRKSLRELGVE